MPQFKVCEAGTEFVLLKTLYASTANDNDSVEHGQPDCDCSTEKYSQGAIFKWNPEFNTLDNPYGVLGVDPDSDFENNPMWRLYSHNLAVSVSAKSFTRMSIILDLRWFYDTYSMDISKFKEELLGLDVCKRYANDWVTAWYEYEEGAGKRDCHGDFFDPKVLSLIEDVFGSVPEDGVPLTPLQQSLIINIACTVELTDFEFLFYEPDNIYIQFRTDNGLVNTEANRELVTQKIYDKFNVYGINPLEVTNDSSDFISQVSIKEEFQFEDLKKIGLPVHNEV